jgi:hypothetical protein
MRIQKRFQMRSRLPMVIRKLMLMQMHWRFLKQTGLTTHLPTRFLKLTQTRSHLHFLKLTVKGTPKPMHSLMHFHWQITKLTPTRFLKPMLMHSR